MLKRKFVKQENLKDCGAACLLMIMRHYGGNYPLEQLCEMMKIDKNGITALNIIETARKVGFDARGYKCDEYKDLKCQSIAHIIINKTYHHFVVIESINIKKELITIADPAFGYKKYTFTEFNQIWTHIVITLYPIRKIDNINTIKSAKKIIHQIVKPYRKVFTLIFILSIIYTIFNTISAFYFKVVIDSQSDSISSHINLLLLFLSVFIIKTIIDYIRSKLLIYVNYCIDNQLMGNTFRHLISLPLMYFNSRATGDIISRLNDLCYVKDLISRVSTILLVDLILVLGSSFVMWNINYKLFVITLIILFLYALVVIIFNQTIKNYVIKNQENEASVSSSFIEIIKGINTIKNLSVEDEMYNKALNEYSKFNESNYKFNNKYNLIKMFKDYILGGGLIIIIFLGGIFINRGAMTVSDFILYIFFLNFFLDPMKNIFDVEPLLRASSNALIRISEFFNIKEDMKNSNVLLVGDISIKSASFAYNGRDKVIDNLSLSINNGDKVMISGPSGCGKSTIAKMIMHHLDVAPTQIIIDNKDICDYLTGDIRNNICYVSQNEIIFTDSLYNNVKLYRNFDDRTIEKVLKITYIDEIIDKHNLDYHMLLEEDGSNLSGGERQRIMVARALLKNSQIYIFDESMSEMSIDLERKVLKNIFNYYSEKTIIVISHRLNNTDLYNRVIALDNTRKIGKEAEHDCT